MYVTHVAVNGGEGYVQGANMPAAPTKAEEEVLKTFTVIDPKTGDLRFWFAGVELVRKAHRQTSHPQTMPARTERSMPRQGNRFVSSELRVWQSFRDPIQTNTKTAIQGNKVSGVVACVSQSAESMIAQYDEAHGGVCSSFTGHDLCTSAFSHSPDVLMKAIEEVKLLAEKLAPQERDAFVSEHISRRGFVSYRRRFLGVKKHKESFVLGLGATASPIEFAVLAGRTDNAALLAHFGSSRESVDRARKIAEGNNFTAIATLLRGKGVSTSSKGKSRNEQPKPAATPSTDP
jgi:hypothetical protein